MDRQISSLRYGVDVIVATPGRFIDLVERDVIKLHDVRATCIDEADQML
jgi:ATP-dependent RNA helicase DeaD